MKSGFDYIGVAVGAVIVNNKGEILFGKRGAYAKNQKGCWETPGGAVEFGEKREQAIKREIKEELGVDIEILKELQTGDEILPREKQHWVATTYLARIKNNKKPEILEPHKCDAIGWFGLDNLPSPLSLVTNLGVESYRRYVSNDRKREIVIRSSDKRKTITICSSVSFYKDVIDVAKSLRKMGFKVLIPNTAYKMQKAGNFNAEAHKTWFKNKNDYKKKTKFMNDHFKKVIQADAVLIINNRKNGIDGYIGGNTLMEMTLAHYFKKKIFVWNEINNSLSMEEEIRGLNPVFINQDLTKIIY